MKKFAHAFFGGAKSIGDLLWNGTVLDVMLAVTVAATLIFAGGMMSGRVASSAKYQVDLRRVTFSLADKNLSARFPWIERGIRSDIAAYAKKRGSASAFDSEMFRELSDVLSKNPWVDEVVKVGPKFPGGVEINLKIRRPVAAVESEMRYYLVDSSNRRLPVTFTCPPDPTLRITVFSVRDGAINPPPVGSVFEEETLSRAAAMRPEAEEITRILHRFDDRVYMIEAATSGSDPAGEINFLTDSGAMLEWGRPAGNAYFELSTAADKIAKLKYVLSKDGELKRGWIYRLWTPMPAAETPDGSYE